MRFASLGSGSSGNCTVMQDSEASFLIDCGFSCKETVRRLETKGVDPESIIAIFVTHEHSDHKNGVATFARKFGTKIMGTPGTLSKLDIVPSNTVELTYGEPVAVGQMDIFPVKVLHDAEEPSQFIVQGDGERFGILTDVGTVSDHLLYWYHECDTLFVEANHDEWMLRNGPYPTHLKRRIAGDLGHLSNDQTAVFVRLVKHSRMRSLVLGHLSKTNNKPEIVEKKFGWLRSDMDVVIATQEEGTDWIEVANRGIVN